MKFVFICLILMLAQDLVNAQILGVPDKPIALCSDPNEYFCGPDIGCKPCCQNSHCPTLHIGGGQLVERICRYLLFHSKRKYIHNLAFYIGTTNA